MCVRKSSTAICTNHQTVIFALCFNWDKKELIHIDYYEEWTRKNLISKEAFCNRMSLFYIRTLPCILFVQSSSKGSTNKKQFPWWTCGQEFIFQTIHSNTNVHHHHHLNTHHPYPLRVATCFLIVLNIETKEQN